MKRSKHYQKKENGFENTYHDVSKEQLVLPRLIQESQGINLRKGYGTKGLQCAIEICKDLVKEDELYFASYKDNPASLAVQLKCHAYITEENEHEVYTRIRLR